MICSPEQFRTIFFHNSAKNFTTQHETLIFLATLIEHSDAKRARTGPGARLPCVWRRTIHKTGVRKCETLFALY